MNGDVTDSGGLELRTVSASGGNFVTREADSGPEITGYFAVFNSAYEICDGCREYVDPHAFDNTLDRDIRALINHEHRLVLGRTAANTLTLSVDPHGLAGTIRVNPQDADAMSLYARVKRGDVSQCSFGFGIISEESVFHENDDSVDFILKEVRLYEVSIVTFPAYTETNVSARDALSRRREQAQTLRKRRLEEQREDLRRILRGVQTGKEAE